TARPRDRQARGRARVPGGGRAARRPMRALSGPRAERAHAGPRDAVGDVLRDLTPVFLEIEHRLSFHYDVFIRESFLELRMQPKTTPQQTLSSFVLAVGPPTKVSRYRDWNGNVVHHFTIVSFHDRIEVSARSAVSTDPSGPCLDDAVDR